MVVRMQIGVNGNPLSVLDASGSQDELTNIFNSNFQVMRGPLIRGAVSVGFHASVNVYYPATYSAPPIFMMLFNNGILYNGVSRTQTAQNVNAGGSNQLGGIALGYTDHLYFYGINTANLGSSMTYYYAVLKNITG